MAHFRRNIAYLFIALIMAYLIADDFLQLHERAGDFFSNFSGVDEFAGLKARHYGEALFLSLFGGLFVGGLVIASMRANKSTKLDIFVFVLMLCLAGVFGVSADLIHAYTGSGFAGVAEDGGELIGVCLIAGFGGFLFVECLENEALTLSAGADPDRY